MSRKNRHEESTERWQEVMPPDGLGYRLKMAAQLLTRSFQTTLVPYDVTVFQFIVLSCLWQEDGLPTSEVTARLQQLGGTMTGVLDGMEKKNLLRRKQDANDRRILRIWLTAKGRKLQDILLPVMAAAKNDAFLCMNEREMSQLSRLCDKMIQHLL